MFFVCVTVGLVILASKYRSNVLRSVKKFCHNIANASNSIDDISSTAVPAVPAVPADDNICSSVFPLDKIILADSPEKCDYAVQRIRRDLSNGVLGFDCEWVNEGAVALLQLATFNGVCALFRLGKIGYVPAKLKELLANKCILKVGVASFEDGRKLTNDYGCRVFGTVDLRTLADRLGVPSRKSLAALTLEYLRVEMDKILQIRCGDWNADILTDQQTTYAAYDAIASVLIYHKIQERARQQRSIWKNILIYVKSVWKREEYQRLDELPEGIIDTRFKGLSVKSEPNNNVGSRQGIQKIINNYKSGGTPRKNNLGTRKEPLYHNCYLEAPDGEVLCTCDRKKAEWYVSRNLGGIVKEEPFTVRLNFEPSGRAFGPVGQYYTQIKVNQCVVCGSTESFIKKNVVPREYRKYFPLVMKAHQSHDVLLLCSNCHEISNRQDLELRRKLADMCDAPLMKSAGKADSPTSPPKGQNPREWRSLLSAVNALREGPSIPPRRRKQLEAHILEFMGEREMKPEFPHILYERFKNQPRVIASSSSPLQERCQPHGPKVVRYFAEQEGGLVLLERMWREHFLDTMRPRFLPNLWSISHNQERLVIRQTQRRIEPSDAKLAGLTQQTALKE